VNNYAYSFLDGVFNPIRLMARNIILTIPTTKLVKNAMTHLFFWPADRYFGVSVILPLDVQ
jgi:hypothetical protein